MVLGVIALERCYRSLMSGAPISRAYYGVIDTHLYGLLLGALLAFPGAPVAVPAAAVQSVLCRAAQPFGLVAFARVMISWLLSLFALIPYATRSRIGSRCDSRGLFASRWHWAIQACSRHACWRLRGAAPG